MLSNSRYKRLFGLIGFPLVHSFSQTFFDQKFESENIDAHYANFEIPSIEHLDGILKKNPNLSGFNVTIPYKEQIFGYLDAVDPVAKAIGAVNVVKIFTQPDGSRTLKGYNSDVIGFGDSIRPMINKDLHKKALVLGTGGAAKAIVHALDSMEIECTMVSRSHKPGTICYDDITPEILKDNLLIINATPIGMYPNIDECPKLPYEALTADHICYDLLYNPDTTLFMRKAAEAGATVKNGLEMLLLQAFVSWNIWNK